MATSEDRSEHERQGFTLSHDRDLDLVEHLPCETRHLLELELFHKAS
jgi:hypothetical protein